MTVALPSEIGSMGFKAGVSQVTKSVASALEKRGVELGVAMSPGVSAIGKAFSWSGEQIAELWSASFQLNVFVCRPSAAEFRVNKP